MATPRGRSRFSLEAIGGAGFAFGPPDFYTFYDETPLLEGGNTGANGSDCIGIFANTNIFAEPSQATILKDYFALFSQDTSFSPDPVITIDFSKETNPGVIGNGADTEAYLDIEAVHLIAPGAPITLYVTNPDKLAFSQNLTDAITAMTTENKCARAEFQLPHLRRVQLLFYDYPGRSVFQGANPGPVGVRVRRRSWRRYLPDRFAQCKRTRRQSADHLGRRH